MKLDFLYVIGSIALTAICWGVYGPVLHRGQSSMDGSRLRPLLCVGMAYFVIAVVVPLLWLSTRGEKGDWTLSGALWSGGGGVAGALGALGIILAFNFGGKPLYVMPAGVRLRSGRQLVPDDLYGRQLERHQSLVSRRADSGCDGEP